MTIATTLIPGLDEIIRNGDPQRRAEAARRIADLFFQGAAQLRPDHVDLFDDILIDLVPHTEVIARAELSERLSFVANAPRMVSDKLARENEILVAAPMLRRSTVLDEKTLLEIAMAKGQNYLLAMSERPQLSANLTDVMVARGDRDVVRRAAGNAGASFSTSGYGELVRRASQDGVLTLTVGQRDDLSDVHLKQLLAGSLDVVRKRLHDVVKPERRTAIRQLSAEITGVAEHFVSKRNFIPAQRTVLSLHKGGNLNEGALFNFAKAGRYEEAVAALSAMSAIPIPSVDNLISSDRHDPILIIGKTLGFEWATVRALIVMRLGPKRIPAPADIEGARINFVKLMPSTAERVVGFWRTRRSA